MHFVDRGPEPNRLKAVQDRLTPKWVAFYRQKKGKKPNDSDWRKFQPDLAKPFQHLCGYCEEFCQGTVDHFHPKSRNPELVYEWSNWVYACQPCNTVNKRDKWPDEGYVDPCAADEPERPEAYFDFDLSTAQIIPRDDLSGVRRVRAVTMIRDLNLNSIPHLKHRVQWVVALGRLLEGQSQTDPRIITILDQMTALSHQNCGILHRVAAEFRGKSQGV